MNDKKLDDLLRASLAPEEIPEGLNERMLKALNKKKQRRIAVFKAARNISSCAAIFICALTVLANFNSDTQRITYNIPVVGKIAKGVTFRRSGTASELEEIPKREEKSNPEANPKASLRDASAPAASEEAPKPEASSEKQPESEKSPEGKPHNMPPHRRNDAPPAQPAERAAHENPHENTEASPAPESASPSEDKAPAAVQGNTVSAAETEATSPSPAAEQTQPQAAAFSVHSRSMPENRDSSAPLSSLFAEDYDYKNSLYAIIYYQMTSSPDKGYNPDSFTEISGSEDYRITDENELVIIFPAGQLAPEENGPCEFNVGKISEGRLSR